MDEFLKQFTPALGAFIPCAWLGWWIIKTQADTIKTKDNRIAELTDALLRLAQSGERTAQVVLGASKPGV